jgi:hypothetical protein
MRATAPNNFTLITEPLLKSLRKNKTFVKMLK